MTNLKKLVNNLGGLFPRAAQPEQISEETLSLIACPYAAAEKSETCPAGIRCAACKREWLGMEAN